MHPPRAVASDVDGTLLRTDGTVSPRTRAALASATDAGVLVVLVTGRPPRWMAPIAEATGHHGVAICANGALLYDLEEERVVGTDPFAPEDAALVAKALRAALPGVTFAVERDDGFGREPGFPARDAASEVSASDGQRAEIAPINELARRPFVKLLAHTDGQEAGAVLPQVRQALAGIAEPTYSMGGGLLEISASGVSKASALERLVSEHSIGAEEVVAFGDMPNDLPMLAWAGHAVAVANAHPEVLAIVDEVTATNDADGVAQVLERLLATRKG